MKLEDSVKTTHFRNEQHKAVINLLYRAYLLKTRISQALKPIGLTVEQFNVLRILQGSHPGSLCVKEIGGRLIEKNSNVPRIADRLVAKNLVARACGKADKRETRLHLTPEGIARLAKASALVAEVEEACMTLNSDESQHLNALLEKVR